MSFLYPMSIAVVGASSEASKVGGAIFQNLMTQGFKGKVFAVNATHDSVQGEKAYKSVSDLPEVPETVVIVTPAKTVSAIAEECGKKGVKNVIVISAGFGETGTDEGHAAEKTLAEICEKYGMTMLGPNCLGMLRPSIGLNASFGKDLPMSGGVALLSQSGALAVAIMDASKELHLGFSSILSLGNKAMLDETKALKMLADDAETKVIGLYLESLKDGKAFLEAAREISKKKRIVLLKAGVSVQGAKAASSHTGALAGSDAAIKALCREAGIARAKNADEFLDLLRVYSTQPELASERIAVVTNAGGPGILATDAAEIAKLDLVHLEEPGRTTLKGKLPAAASVGNPIDVLGDAAADRYLSAIEAASRDPNVDGLCVILTPQIMTPVAEVARTIVKAKKTRPLLAITVSFFGNDSVQDGIQILAEAGIPNFGSPERAIHALAALQAAPRDDESNGVPMINADRQAAAQKILAGKTGALSEDDANALFALYQLPLPKASIARDPNEAATMAKTIGFPVAMKVSSPQILHKTEVGGVRIGVKNEAEVKAAYEEILIASKKHMPDADLRGVLIQEMLPAGHEFIVGAIKDPNMGHLIMAGLGGIYTELFRDTVFRIAPVSEKDAYRMLEELRSWKLLLGMRGKEQSNIPSLAETIEKIAMLVMECPQITELDLNPVIVNGDGTEIADAKVVL